MIQYNVILWPIIILNTILCNVCVCVCNGLQCPIQLQWPSEVNAVILLSVNALWYSKWYLQ